MSSSSWHGESFSYKYGPCVRYYETPGIYYLIMHIKYESQIFSQLFYLFPDRTIHIVQDSSHYRAGILGDQTAVSMLGVWFAGITRFCLYTNNLLCNTTQHWSQERRHFLQRFGCTIWLPQKYSELMGRLDADSETDWLQHIFNRF